MEAVTFLLLVAAAAAAAAVVVWVVVEASHALVELAFWDAPGAAQGRAECRLCQRNVRRIARWKR